MPNVKRIYSSTDQTKYNLIVDGELVLDTTGQPRNFTPAEAKAFTEKTNAAKPEKAKEPANG